MKVLKAMDVSEVTANEVNRFMPPDSRLSESMLVIRRCNKLIYVCKHMKFVMVLKDIGNYEPAKVLFFQYNTAEDVFESIVGYIFLNGLDFSDKKQNSVNGVDMQAVKNLRENIPIAYRGIKDYAARIEKRKDVSYI